MAVLQEVTPIWRNCGRSLHEIVAIIFSHFGFYLDEVFVKRNRTKTYILYSTQLASYIDVCLIVPEHFSGSWILKAGTRCFNVKEVISLTNSSPCTSTCVLFLFKEKVGGLRVNSSRSAPWLPTQAYLSLLSDLDSSCATFELCPLRGSLLCYFHYPEHSFLSPLYLANSYLAIEFSFDLTSSRKPFRDPRSY